MRKPNGTHDAPDDLSAPTEPLPAADELPSLPPPPAEPVLSLGVRNGSAPAAAPAEAGVNPLEQRLRRLEDALAQLQDLQGMESRVAERVAGRLIQEKPATPADAHAAVLVDLGKRLLRAPVDAARSVVNPPPTAAGGPRAGRAWLVWEALAEARAIARMFVDPRYRLSRSGKILPLVLVACIGTSYYWVPLTSVPVLGTMLNKAADLLLAFVLFKLLGHEARRYRETAPDLPPSLRL